MICILWARAHHLSTSKECCVVTPVRAFYVSVGFSRYILQCPQREGLVREKNIQAGDFFLNLKPDYAEYRNERLLTWGEVFGQMSMPLTPLGRWGPGNSIADVYINVTDLIGSSELPGLSHSNLRPVRHSTKKLMWIRRQTRRQTFLFLLRKKVSFY